MQRVLKALLVCRGRREILMVRQVLKVQLDHKVLKVLLVFRDPRVILMALLVLRDFLVKMVYPDRMDKMVLMVLPEPLAQQVFRDQLVLLDHAV